MEAAMSDVATLLPSSASQFERDMEQATARLGAVSVPLRPLWNADTIPENLLPWLAWARDVPFWNKGADVKEKRAIVNASLDLHRRRGTLSCFRDMARYAGAELVKTITPPAKTFCARTMTQAERNTFLERMPQLRFFTFRNQASSLYGGIRAAMNWKNYPVAASGYGMFPVQSTAAARLGVNAFIHTPDGVDTPLVSIDRSTQSEMKNAVSTQEVREASTTGRATFTMAGGFINWLIKSTARSRFYSVRLITPYLDSSETLHKKTLEPSMQAVDVHYDTVAEQGTRAGMFIGGSFIRAMFQKTYAGDRLYKRLYLFDKNQTLEPRGMTTHLGGTRLGMKPHNAEMIVRITGERSIRAVDRFVSGFMQTAPRTVYNNTMQALRFAMRLSDRVLIDTSPRHVTKSRSTIKAGDVFAGQWT